SDRASQTRCRSAAAGLHHAFGGPAWPASSAIALTVCASAGKKASIVTSESVTSTAVPKTVVVLRNDKGPAGLVSVSGTAIAPASTRAGRRGPASGGAG